MNANHPLFEQARALGADGRHAEAEALLRPQIDQHDPVAALELSWIRRGAGDEAGAFEALRAFGFDPACRERMAEMLLGERRGEEALQVLASTANAPAPHERVNAAIRAHLAGDFRAALEAAREGLRQSPGHAPAHNHAARALHNMGRVPEARAAFERALELDPRYPEAWHNLGHVLRVAGDADAAISAFSRALAIAPGYLSARINLGITYFEAQRPEEALRTFEAMLAGGQPHVEALVGSGLCLHLLGQPQKARHRYESALELAPDHPSAWYYLGSVCNELGDVASARDALQRALALNPSDADAWAELAGVHELSSELDAAAEAVRRGLAVAQGHPQLVIEAAKLDRRRGDTLGAEARLRALDPQRMPPRVRQQFLYEFGNVLDRNLQIEAAHEAFAQANALAALGVRARQFNPEAWFDGVRAISAWLEHGAPGMDARDDDPDRGADLCFLVGFPRSGTTLLDTILGAHPAVSLLEEKPTLVPVMHTLGELPGGYPAALATLESDDRRVLRKLYRQSLSRHGAQPGRTVVDKLPLRTIHLGLVQALFPQARVLVSLRHPCDVVLSNFMQQYAVNEAFVNFYSLADATRLYDAVFTLWQKLRPRLSLPVAEVRYEDLVLDPAREASAAFAFLGLDWDPALLDVVRRTGGRGRITTNSYHQVAEPIYDRSIGRWKRYRGYLAPHLPVLEAHARRLGYAVD